MDWKLIDEAPKDRSLFLAVDMNEPVPYPAIVRWGFDDYNKDMEHYQNFTESGGDCWVVDGSADLEMDTQDIMEPTHWMPLPELPIVQKNENLKRRHIPQY